MAIILDGKKLRDKILEKLAEEVKTFSSKPGLAVILVGDDAASQVYVNNKKKISEKIGINSQIFHYPSNTQESVLIDKIEKLNNDNKVNAILVQLPLPSHISKENVINRIDSNKDVDGFTYTNSGKLFVDNSGVVPCTPKGIVLLLNEYNIKIEGKHVVVVGRSNIVGKPMAQLMLQNNATVTICHSKTSNLEQITRTADRLISAVGKQIITSNMVKSDCAVIDVGIFRDNSGKLRGDVDFENVSKKVEYISPVPGGVGPMTITGLRLNTVELYKNMNSKNT